MNVRKRLVAGFVSVALFVLALFGFVAHRTAIHVDTAQELTLLQGVADSHAQLAINGLPANPTAEEIMRRLPDKMVSGMVMAILDANNEFLTNDANGEKVENLLSSAEYQEYKVQARQANRIGQTLSWAKAPLVGTPYTLLVIQHADADLPTFSTVLAKRLVVTAFIIVWLAAWIALAVSKRITKRLEEQNAALAQQAWFDRLTGLPNRYHLNKRLNEYIAKSKSFSLFVVDLNNLREVNDALGHEAGDTLIEIAAGRITGEVPRAIMVARLGGDSFAVMVDELSSKDEIDCSRRLITVFSTPLVIKGLEIVTHPSIGMAEYPEHAEDALSLIKRAEVAMYRAKQERKEYQLYSPEIDPYSMRQLALMSDLSRAVEERQIVNFYQPKIELQSMKTTGVETLVRWIHPEQGMVPPNDFISLAEKSELINKMTLSVLEESIRQCRIWHDAGFSIGVAVNLSARNLYDPHLLAHIKHCLEKWQIEPEQLKLEITESILMADPQAALRTLNQLDEMGISLSIDDYGTGYSSLSYIKRLPVSEIKIDRSFVRDMMVDENDAFIVTSTIDLAHNLGCCVVAEGIEDEETLQRLRELGCDYGQGFLMSRPSAPDELDEWLSQSKWPGALMNG